MAEKADGFLDVPVLDVAVKARNEELAVVAHVEGKMVAQMIFAAHPYTLVATDVADLVVQDTESLAEPAA